jgi:integrase/recombinase XerC
MTAYVDSVRKPPKTLTADEQRRLLAVTGDRMSGFRDHVLFSFALGTAMREHELVALTVGSVCAADGSIRRRFPLRVFKRSNLDFDAQEAILPDALRYKLEKFLRWKKAQDEPLDDDSPLFLSREKGAALSTRSVRDRFAVWQKAAGFERRMHFHSLRHTALTNLYQATKDIRLVQRVARHKSVLSTTIYAQANDDDVLRAVRGLEC